MRKVWLFIGLLIFVGGFGTATLWPQSLPYVIICSVVSIAVYIAHMTLANRKVEWQALAAIGTIGGVAWAVFSQDLVDKINPPKLDLELYETDNDRKRLNERMGSYLTGIVDGKPTHTLYPGYFIDIKVLNKGETIAKDVAVVVSEKWNRSGNSYVPDKSWKPLIPLFNEPASGFSGMIPPNSKLPYVFSVGSFSVLMRPNFLFTYAYLNKARKETIKPGEYCLVLEVSASNAKPQERYLYFSFEGFPDAVELPGVFDRIKPPDLSKRHPSTQVLKR